MIWADWGFTLECCTVRLLVTTLCASNAEMLPFSGMPFLIATLQDTTTEFSPCKTFLAQLRTQGFEDTVSRKVRPFHLLYLFTLIEEHWPNASLQEKFPGWWGEQVCGLEDDTWMSVLQWLQDSIWCQKSMSRSKPILQEQLMMWDWVPCMLLSLRGQRPDSSHESKLHSSSISLLPGSKAQLRLSRIYAECGCLGVGGLGSCEQGCNTCHKMKSEAVMFGKMDVHSFPED